jgi:hypothetical protein
MPAAFGLMRSIREGDPRLDGFRLCRCLGKGLCPIGDSFLLDSGLWSIRGQGCA